MFKELSKEETQTYIQWAQDNYHSKVGPTGAIKALWHPVVRQEMKRLQRKQMDTIKSKVS